LFDRLRRGQEGRMPEDIELLPDELLRVETKGDSTETVIAVEGELDASGAGWFGACVSKALETRPDSIDIDFRGLTFMDSSGLRSLLLARAAVHEARVAFRITESTPALRHLVERTGLLPLLLDQ
jgi:anti-anti-sigma factor